MGKFITDKLVPGVLISGVVLLLFTVMVSMSIFCIDMTLELVFNVRLKELF